jgi:hypothetical protein
MGIHSNPQSEDKCKIQAIYSSKCLATATIHKVNFFEMLSNAFQRPRYEKRVGDLITSSVQPLCLSISSSKLKCPVDVLGMSFNLPS